ncbi:MAG: YfcE family phosphodiesterase [Caldivirga sp.]|nr:YfcE family phosphodiesterase [Caldivirga sp.]
MVKIAVLGDSHIASGGLPNGCLLNMVKVGGFDLLVHVGDLSNEQVLKELEGIGRLVVVAGETDPMPLPDKEIIDVEGVRLLVIHGHQKEARLHLRRMVNYFNARLVLMGHTHRPMVQDLGGVLVVNPGSFTGFNGSSETMAILELAGGRINIRIQGCGWFNEYKYGNLIVRADELASILSDLGPTSS